ncbi:MAG: energy transducer TonB [Candidatus Omnitrophota bacterium]
MIKVLMLIFLTVCGCLTNLYAQEVTGQGWSVPVPRQRSTSAISMTATGTAYDPLRSPSETLIPAAIQHKNGEESRTPFPILTPKVIVYPRKAVRRGWEGQTVIAAEVLPDGSVGRTALAKSSGHEVLDQAAEEAIQSWKFANETEKNEPVPQYVDIPVTFKLQAED